MLQWHHISTAAEREFKRNPSIVLLVVVCVAAAGGDVIESNVPQAYIGRYVGRLGMVGCSCQMHWFSLYGEMRLCSAVDVASFPASSE